MVCGRQQAGVIHKVCILNTVIKAIIIIIIIITPLLQP